MTLEYLSRGLNDKGEPKEHIVCFIDHGDGEYTIKYRGKHTWVYHRYCSKDLDGNPILCFICNKPCIQWKNNLTRNKRDNGTKPRRPTCTWECRRKLTGDSEWNPLYISRDDDGWFLDNYTGYMIRRYRPVKGKPRIKEFYHRWVMEQHLGRKLTPEENVHHIDMDKLNNDISNLWLCSHLDHLNSHHSSKQLIPSLLKRGIIKFNINTGIYLEVANVLG